LRRARRQPRKLLHRPLRRRPRVAGRRVRIVRRVPLVSNVLEAEAANIGRVEDPAVSAEVGRAAIAVANAAKGAGATAEAIVVATPEKDRGPAADAPSKVPPTSNWRN
jgi:hypothetical protein